MTDPLRNSLEVNALLDASRHEVMAQVLLCDLVQAQFFAHPFKYLVHAIYKVHALKHKCIWVSLVEFIADLSHKLGHSPDKWHTTGLVFLVRSPFFSVI